MTSLSHGDFGAFFQAIHNHHEPFPWQQRLAKRVCGERGWPRCIALPTAAGKTACIDIAIFALACQAALTPEKRTTPRRIFFVVDRRVVVDQAYDHGRDLAEKLDRADDGTLWAVAEVLRSLSRSGWREFPEADRRRILEKRRTWKYKKDWKPKEQERYWDALRPDEREWIDISPLDVYALRGGMYRESAWVRSPLQPTVITSTVDQVGSRLLFRGYGVSDSSKPLHAALVGNDALVLLDEAHCARPFDQTMSLVEKYRGKDWAKEPLSLPFHFVTMTATPSAGTPENEIERLGEDDREHPVLGERIAATKPARLEVSKAKGDKWEKWGPTFAKDLADHAASLQKRGFLGVGVIVNRVATARKVAELLRAPLLNALVAARAEPDTEKRRAMEAESRAKATDVILLTGRMRPVDRDAIMAKLEPLLSKNSTKEGGEMKPAFVVATQTIEVGADLDFHVLVTECASLDALRQRFGRLNRVAARDKAEAVIVVRADQTEPSKDDADADPVYGNSLAKTWQWLNKHASIVTPNPTDPPLSGDEPRAKKGRRKGKGSDSPASASAAKIIDFGVAEIDALLIDPKTRPDDLAALNAPSPDAAVLLPAHLDMWCQTSPRPVPDPDPSYFLHGPQRFEPEVQVVFRADLKWDDSKSREENEETWAKIVSLCPPSSSEALPVRLSVFERWIAAQNPADDSSDVEGERTATDSDERDGDESETTLRRALRWNGPDLKRNRRARHGQDTDDEAGTCLIDSVAALWEGRRRRDVYVVPIAPDANLALLGDFPTSDDGTPRVTDAGDEAFQRSRDKAILRLVPALFPLKPAGNAQTCDAAFESVEDSPEPSDPDSRIASFVQGLAGRQADADDEADVSEKEVRELLEKIAVEEREKTPNSRKWLLCAIEALLEEKKNRLDIEPHPLGGLVLIGKRRLHKFDPTFVEPEDSWESSSDCAVPLAQHCDEVAVAAGFNSRRVGLPSAIAVTIERAGKLHDVGKADPRFQAMLHGNKWLVDFHNPIAKSKRRSPDARRIAFERSGLPAGTRHELYSTAMAAHPVNNALAGIDPSLHDLVLHLIASHHGHARPFAPIAAGDLDRVMPATASNGSPRSTISKAAIPFTFAYNGGTLTFTPDESTISGHGLERLDSGVAERFWMLTRRYGWWGLPYLEALLRLADWACSEPGEARESSSDGRAPVAAATQETMP